MKLKLTLTTYQVTVLLRDAKRHEAEEVSAEGRLAWAAIARKSAQAIEYGQAKKEKGREG